ncbi:MAG: hypothetical protein QOC68_1220, partial [Solirubrobacteraceae bacterium]|nr:hypothetical protein [Solirubrobacteraceae bacterium]
MSSRDAVLGRIRTALGPRAEPPPIPREYRAAGAAQADVVALFCERAADYLATVRRVTAQQLD